MTPNDYSNGRTATLTSKRCILYIYSTNICTEYLNPLTPNDYSSGRTATLTSKRCILYIYSTNICTEYLNPLAPNDDYRGRTAPLTSKCCILYIYSTHICTEYFKHGIYSPFFFPSKCGLFHNSNVFGSVLFTFYIQGVLKLKINSGAKSLNRV